MKQVHCVKLYTRTDVHFILRVQIQAYVDEKWKNSWIQDNLSHGTSSKPVRLYVTGKAKKLLASPPSPSWTSKLPIVIIYHKKESILNGKKK
jgi:hypothetical protein